METNTTKENCPGCMRKQRRLLEDQKMFEVEQKMLLEKYNKKMELKDRKLKEKSLAK